MKIWLTAPYDPKGIKEIDTTSDPVGDCFSFIEGGTFHTSHGWYLEGSTWHRTKASAFAAAQRHRANWISETEAAAARVRSLPPIEGYSDA